MAREGLHYMRKEVALILLILVLASLVRVIGIDFGLPFQYHNDESVIVNYALAYGQGDLNPHYFRIPPLPSYILFVAYGAMYVVGRIFGVFSGVNDFGVSFLQDPTLFYVVGRVLLGFLPGVISVYLIYIFGKKLFSNRVGLLAALFLSVNFLHVKDSHYIYNDILLVMFIIAYLIALLGMFRTERLRYYVWGGLFLGAGISAKYNAAFLLVPTAAVVFINMFMSRRYPFGDALKKGGCFLVFLLMALFVTNPFMLLDPLNFWKELGKTYFFPSGFWHHLNVSVLGSMGLLMAAAAFAGLAGACRKRDKFSIILLIYTVFYYLVLTRSSQSGPRYIFPILPVLLVYAAYFLDHVISLARGRVFKIGIGAGLTAALIFYPCLKVYYLDRLFVAEDTRTKAYDWVMSNIGKRSVIAIDATGPIHPNLSKSKAQLREELKSYEQPKFPKPKGAMEYKIKLMLESTILPEEMYWLYYMKHDPGRKVFLSSYPEINMDIKELMDKNVDYVVLNRVLMREEENSVFLKDLEANAVPVKEFSPYKTGITRIVPIEQTDEPAAAFSFAELSERESFGPVLRIYKIKK